MFQPTVPHRVFPQAGKTRPALAALCRVASPSFARFFAASLLAFGLDLCLAWTVLTTLHLSLVAAAAVSAVVVAFGSYFVHELWTFRDGRRQVSAARMTATVLSAGSTLAIRSACLTLTARVLDQHWAMLQFFAAAGLSFTANYLVVRSVLDRRPAPIS